MKGLFYPTILSGILKKACFNHAFSDPTLILYKLLDMLIIKRYLTTSVDRPGFFARPRRHGESAHMNMEWGYVHALQCLISFNN